MKEIEAIREAEERAVLQMISFAKSLRSIPTDEETSAVEDAMELAGCNAPTFANDRRWIEAQVILRDCITRTDRSELRRIESALWSIANN